MRKKIIIRLVCLFAFVLAISFLLLRSGYFVSIDKVYVKQQIWSHKQGLRLHTIDFLDFYESKKFSIQNDTIYYLGVPTAKIIRINKLLGEMIIQSVSTKEEGRYHNNPSLGRL